MSKVTEQDIQQIVAESIEQNKDIQDLAKDISKKLAKKIVKKPMSLSSIFKLQTQQEKNAEVMTGSIEDIKNEAIDRSFTHANERYRDEGLKLIEEVCLQRLMFTVDDFRDELLERGVTTHDNRAMGGLIRTAVKRGWLERTGMTIRSRVGHGGPLQIWKSTICEL